jgi:hypothetical protein
MNNFTKCARRIPSHGEDTPHEVFEENKIEPEEPPRHYFSAAKVHARKYAFISYPPRS